MNLGGLISERADIAGNNPPQEYLGDTIPRPSERSGVVTSHETSIAFTYRWPNGTVDNFGSWDYAFDADGNCGVASGDWGIWGMEQGAIGIKLDPLVGLSTGLIDPEIRLAWIEMIRDAYEMVDIVYSLPHPIAYSFLPWTHDYIFQDIPEGTI